MYCFAGKVSGRKRFAECSHRESKHCAAVHMRQYHCEASIGSYSRGFEVRFRSGFADDFHAGSHIDRGWERYANVSSNTVFVYHKYYFPMTAQNARGCTPTIHTPD